MIPLEHVAGWSAVLIAYGLCGVVPLVFLILSGSTIVHSLFLAARARHAERAMGDLVPGPCVLHGKVQYVAGENLAVRVEISQNGEFIRDDVVWEETARRSSARPFYIQDVRGLRVRVEPPEDVVLVDALDETHPISNTGRTGTRTRSGGLDEGEEVYALGKLVNAPDPEAPSGYRSHAVRPVLRGGRARMLISSEPLARRFLSRARFHAAFAVLVAVVTAILHFMLLDYHALASSGVQEQATVQSIRTWQTRGKSGTLEHASVRVRLADGREPEWEVEPHTTGPVVQGSQTPVVRNRNFVHLGSGPNVSIGMAFASTWAFGLVGVFYGLLTYRRRPWYERKLRERTQGFVE